MALAENNALDYISTLLSHTEEMVFQAAQELREMYLFYDNEFGDQEYVLEADPRKMKMDAEGRKAGSKSSFEMKSETSGKQASKSSEGMKSASSGEKMEL